MSLPRLWTREPRADTGRVPSHAARNGKTRFVLSIKEFVFSPRHWGWRAGNWCGGRQTYDALEVTAELPGVDENDIKVSLDDNQLIISGEKKAESTKDEKYWHVEERSYGSFYRSMFLPFEPFRRMEPSTLISTRRLCCISRSRSPLRP